MKQGKAHLNNWMCVTNILTRKTVSRLSKRIVVGKSNALPMFEKKSREAHLPEAIH